MPEHTEPSTRVVVVGDALIDEVHAENRVQEFVGGAALNVAVGLSRLGLDASLIAMVGDDPDGETIRAFLKLHGVRLIPTLGPNGSSRGISARINGEPTYEFNDAALARRIDFGPAEIAALAEAQLVVVSCFPFDDLTQTDSLMAAVAHPGRRLIVDANPRPTLIHDQTRFMNAFEQIAAQCLLVKVGDDDAQLLTDTNAEQLAERLLARGTVAALATMGEDGATVMTARGLRVTVPIATMSEAIVDTMGAGDATLASVVQSIINRGVPTTDEGWREVLGLAMRIAAATCRQSGALLQAL